MLIPPDKKSAEGPVQVARSQPSDIDLEAGHPSQAGDRSIYGAQEGSTIDVTRASEERLGLLPSPPSYDESTAARKPAEPPSPPHRYFSHGSVLRRFMVASCVAVALLIPVGVLFGLLGDLVKVVVKDGKMRHGHQGQDGDGNVGRHDGSERYKDVPGSSVGWDGKWNPDWSYDQPLLPIEVDPRNCDLWGTPIRLREPIQNDYLYGTTTTFALPLSALEHHTAFVHFRDGATISGGYVRLQAQGAGKVAEGNPELVHRKTGSKDKDTIDVVVEAYYRDPRDFYGTHICEAGADGNAGVVLMNSYGSKIYDQDIPNFRGPLYHVYVTLPEMSSQAGGPRVFNDIELHSANMRTEISGDMASVCKFNDASIKGHNGGVSIDSIAATTLLGSTSNGRVEVGRLDVAEMARLRSSNAPIICHNCCAERWQDRTRQVVLETTNGAIEAGEVCAQRSISLTSSSGRIEGNFDAPRVDGRSSNGRITGAFTGIRGDEWDGLSGLSLRTSNAAIDVEIDVGDGKPRGGVKVPVERTEYVHLDLTSTNGNVKAALRDLTADVQVDLAVKTSNSGIEIHGNSHFQGEFNLETSSHSNAQVSKLPALSGEPGRDLAITSGGSSRGGFPWDGGKGGKMKGTVIRRGDGRDSKHVWSKIRAVTSNGPIRAEL